MRYIDSHCHLYAQEFSEDVNAVITRAQEAGVTGSVVVSESADDFGAIRSLQERYPGWIYPSFGVHPIQNESRSVTLKDLAEALLHIEANRDNIVSVGEVGLDFTPWLCKSDEDKHIQIDVFEKQIALADSLNLPLNIHSRSAAKRTVEILKKCGARSAVLHNFAGKPSVGMEAVQLGYFLSFPPSVLNKPERNNVIKRIPLDHIVLETDSPALGPEKGVRNEPCNIRLVCEHVAKLKNMDSETVAKITFENTIKIFPKLGNAQQTYLAAATL